MAVCKQCGAQLNDGVKFCNKCGTPVEAAQSTGADVVNGFNASELGDKVGDVANGVASKGKELFDDNIKGFKNKDRNSQIKIIAVIAAVVVVLAGCLLWTKSAPKRAAKKYLKAVEKMDTDKMEKMLPKFFKSWLDEEDLEFSDANTYAYYAEEYDTDDLKITCEITKVKKVDRDDVKDLKEAIEDGLDTKAKFSKAYQVKYKYKIKAEDDELEYLETDGKESGYLLVVKEGFKWKVVNIGSSVKDYIDALD